MNLPPSNARQIEMFPSLSPEIRGQFFDRYITIATRAALRWRLGSHAREICNTWLYRLTKDRDEYDPARPFWPWAIAYLSYILHEVHRREGRHATQPLAADVPAHQDFVAQICHVELLHAVKTLILTQCPNGEIAWAYFTNDQSAREIGAAFGVSEATVNRAIRDARALVQSHNLDNQLDD
jgi:DNA-directed RNA polymerase specialized sigma24 family protein